MNKLVTKFQLLARYSESLDRYTRHAACALGIWLDAEATGAPGAGQHEPAPSTRYPHEAAQLAVAMQFNAASTISLQPVVT